MSEAMMPHSEVAEEGMFADLANLLQLIIDKLEGLEQRHAKLEGVVMDDIIGGISGLYKDNLRVENIGALRSKYGELFKDHEAAYKDLYDSDLWESLMDHLDGIRGEEGFDEDATIKGLAEALKGKIEKLRGEKPAVAVEVTKTEEKPAEAALEKPAEAPAAEEDMMGPVVERIKRMKARKEPGIRGE